MTTQPERERQRIREAMRAHYRRHKNDPEYRQAHIRASTRSKHNHPEFDHTYRQKRMEQVYGRGSFTWQEFYGLCAEHHWLCTYCHNELPLVPDHKIPLSRGGSNTIDNITPSCKSCNSRKGTKTFEEFMLYLSKDG